MKLHYYSGSTLPSGYANSVHVMKMCSAFVQACGFDVTLFGKDGGGSVGRLYDAYDVPPCFRIMRSPRTKVPGLSAVFRAFMVLLRGMDADIIYGRDPWTLWLAAICGKNFVVELHEIPHGGLQSRVLRFLLRSSGLRGVVVITNGLKEDLQVFAPFLPSEKILVAPDGADLPAAPIIPAPLEIIAGTTMQAGYGGSLYKGKGVELIIEIAKLRPDVGFHLFGGPQTELEKWRAQNLPANIKFYGHIEHALLKARLASCDVLLAPYMPKIHIDTGADIGRWISPLKLFEYMALKKPILCSDLPVLREVMQNRRNALLVNPENPQDWGLAIRLIGSDKGLAVAVSQAAYEDLKNRLNWACRARAIGAFVSR